MLTLLGFVVVNGILKGYDQLMNLVLDNVKEVTRGMSTVLLRTLSLHLKYPLYAVTVNERAPTNLFRRRGRQHKYPLSWSAGRAWHPPGSGLARRR